MARLPRILDGESSLLSDADGRGAEGEAPLCQL